MKVIANILSFLFSVAATLFAEGPFQLMLSISLMWAMVAVLQPDNEKK